MTFQYFGHSCFQLQIGDQTILVDPFISPNPLAQGIDLRNLCPNFILVSHGHGDHVADLITIATQSDATVIANYEIAEWAKSKGVKNAIGMNTGGVLTTAFGKVRLTNAVHSSVLPDGSNGGNPNVFLIHSAEGNLYYAGDTALHMDMQLIPLWAPQLDVAILPIGDHFTMGVEDAMVAAQWTKAKKVIPVHYNTFPPITIDTEKAQEQFASARIELRFCPLQEIVVL